MVNPQSRFSCARDTKGEGQCRGLLLSADASWRTATLKTPYATQARLHAVALTAAFACQGDKRLNDGSTQMGQAAGDHAMHASALRLGQSYSQRAYLRGEVRKDGLICRGHKNDEKQNCNASPGQNCLFGSKDISYHILSQGLGALQHMEIV